MRVLHIHQLPATRQPCPPGNPWIYSCDVLWQSMHRAAVFRHSIISRKEAVTIGVAVNHSSFRAGDHVTIAAGEYTGATGLVAAVNGGNPACGILESADIELQSGRFVPVCTLDLKHRADIPTIRRDENDEFRLTPIIEYGYGDLQLEFS